MPVHRMDNVGIVVEDLPATSFRFQRNAYGSNRWQVAWSAPVVKGQWYRFSWHLLFSAAGWVELYVNDVQQKLKLGTTSVTRMPIALLDPTDSTGPWDRR